MKMMGIKIWSVKFLAPTHDTRYSSYTWYFSTFCATYISQISTLNHSSPVDFVGLSACRHVLGFRDLAVDVTQCVTYDIYDIIMTSCDTSNSGVMAPTLPTSCRRLPTFA
eukprot:scaffold72735_cov26-Cyclotella_meneghiniana.AAC.1